MTDESAEKPSPPLEFEDAVAVDPEGGEDEEDVSATSGRSRATVSATDWTVETLLTQMRKGRIDLSPRFQRRSAWTEATKSRFIESVILSYPIPQIVLAEKPDRPGHFLVIDGKQRLLALRQFFAPDEPNGDFAGYRLSGVTILNEIKGWDVARLREKRPDLVDQFENHTIRTVAIRSWGEEGFLFRLFHRLNTGSVPLSPQELRQALVPGPFVDYVDTASGESIGLRRLLGNAGPDRRMVDAELLVRFFAIQSPAIQYSSNLKVYLDKTCSYFNDRWDRNERTLQDQLEALEEAIAAATTIFGADGVSRKWTGTRYERAFNRAVFDVQMYALAITDVREAALHQSDAVERAYKALCEDDSDFVRSITTTTKSTAAFRIRFGRWRDSLGELLEIHIPLPASLESTHTRA